MIHPIGKLILLYALLLGTTTFAIAQSETLVIVDTKENVRIDSSNLSKIRELADEMNIDIIQINEENGLPDEIKTFPSIYFQNEKGRSKYYGRYTNISRLKNFIRISKMIHQKNESVIKNQLLVYQDGRAITTLNVKVTELSGFTPEGFDASDFNGEVIRNLAMGMGQFRLMNDISTDKSTRSFYVNIYPYLSEVNDLCITTEVFSQYNCIKPIYKSVDTPIEIGQWTKRDQVIAKAGNKIEKEIMAIIKSSILGDAFEAIPNDIKSTGWDELGLAINAPMKDKVTSAQRKIDLAQSWTVEETKNDDDPITIFSFLAPVDNYAGEVKKISGSLDFDDDLKLASAKGSFKVKIKDVTMGAEDFDYEVQNKMLQMDLFPDAHFTFEGIQSESVFLNDSKSHKIQVAGKFTMLDITIPVQVEGTLETNINTSGLTLLNVNCSFDLPLKEKFGVKGPDGPSPEKDTLRFYMNFNLIPNN